MFSNTPLPSETPLYPDSRFFPLQSFPLPLCPCLSSIQVPFPDAYRSRSKALLPPALKAATGVDALTHAIEGYITRGAWALTDALHIKAIEIIAGALRGSVAGDKDAGEEMALGQYVAGMGFSNVGLGLVHGMAHPLGAFYNTPHGVANAILLPHVMRYNADFTGEKYRDIARVMGVKVEGMSLEEARNAAVEAVFALNRDVGIPPHLRDVGVRKEDIPALAQAALDDVCTGGNPREATLEDIVELYHTAW